jgi:hypothetical protein
MSTAVLIVWLLILLFVVVGNMLYFAKVLPALGESPTWGSAQLKQIDRFIASLGPEQARPWFYPFLKNVRLVGAVLLALWLMVGVMDRLHFV